MSDAPPPAPPPPADESWRYPPPVAAQPTEVHAPWWRRVLAILIDGLIVGAPLGVLGAIFGWAEVVHSNSNGQDTVQYHAKPALILASFVTTLVYSALMDGSWRGATVGKMALRIQVRDAAGGGPIGPGRAFVRRLVYLLLFYALLVPGVINALSPLWDRRRQAWHDKAVNSVVVNAT